MVITAGSSALSSLQSFPGSWGFQGPTIPPDLGGIHSRFIEVHLSFSEFLLRDPGAVTPGAVRGTEKQARTCYPPCPGLSSSTCGCL